MVPKIIIPAIIAIVVTIGAVVALSGGSDEDSTVSTPSSSNSTNSSDDSAQAARPTTPTSSTGVDRYVTYSDSVLADSTDSKRVLFFHATWCTVCNAFEREIKAEGVPEGITLIKANFDNDTDLKKEYGITVQSTFVLLDENNEAVRSWPFGQGLSNIGDLYEQVQSS